LVVDLDQTIIHAAVDPTIGEWLDECFGKGSNVCELRAADGRLETRAVEARKTEGEAESVNVDGEVKAGEEATTAKETTSDNPNADAIRDVFRFQLPNELPPHLKGRYRQVIRHEDLCWYYIKPRQVPALQTSYTS
jgi:RNA polymerase II subunit A-like phosphatase